ncbi:MAG: signal peptidase II [Rickettsiales bacterium]|jgi:signal peptidase II|nr:signal peptidase II [Rickettsiales bacterium]
MKLNKLFLCGLSIASIIFVLDIWTKRFAFAKVDAFNIKTGGAYNYIKVTNFLNISRVMNTGVSFGLFQNIKYGQIFLSIVTFALICYLFVSLWYNTTKYLTFVYSIIIGGGLGNLYDRIVYGGVFDFIDFHYNSWHYPSFNLADSFICIGVFLLAILEFKEWKRKKPEK